VQLALVVTVDGELAQAASDNRALARRDRVERVRVEPVSDETCADLGVCGQ